jgi:carbohydrate-selective porin OprB
LPHPYEPALERLYQAPLWKWAALMPDLPFIIHPGGRYSDALVGTLDLTIQF